MNARGGAANWVNRLHASLFTDGRDLRRTELPVRVWEVIEEIKRRQAERTSPSRSDPPPATRTNNPARQPRVRTKLPRYPQNRSDESEWGPEVLTPNSTNVYSFRYYRRPGEQTGTLYVTFKAHSVSNTTKGHDHKGGKWSREQLIGTAGRTVGQKGSGPGATYAYLRVPPNIYEQLHAVRNQGDQHGPGTKSPGTGVWELLRIRGTIHGHKYTYVLMQGQIDTGQGGVYIPRKATAQGFRTRSLRDAGTGPGGFKTSTLPEQQGFSTRRRR